MGRERLPRGFGRKKRLVPPLVIGAAALAAVLMIAGWVVWDRRGPSAAVWMNHYCGSSLALRSDVDGVNDTLKSQIRNRKSASEIGRTLNIGIDGLVARSNTMRTHMDAVGKPGGGDGAEVQETAIERADKIASDLSAVKAQSAGMAFGNSWVVEGGSRNAQASLNNLSAYLSDAYEDFSKDAKYAELKKAGDALPSKSCTQLRTRNGVTKPAP